MIDISPLLPQRRGRSCPEAASQPLATVANRLDGVDLDVDGQLRERVTEGDALVVLGVRAHELPEVVRREARETDLDRPPEKPLVEWPRRRRRGGPRSRYAGRQSRTLYVFVRPQVGAMITDPCTFDDTRLPMESMHREGAVATIEDVGRGTDAEVDET